MIWTWSPAALAHEVGLSRLVLDGERVELVLSASELAERYPLGDGGAEALERVSGVLIEDTWDRLALTVDGAPCALSRPTVAPEEEDGVSLVGTASCPPGSRRTVRAGHPELLSPGHRVQVERDGHPIAVLTRDAPEAEVEGAPSTASTAAAFFELGVEHILTGWDHLAFLAALLLVARSFRQVAAIVTGFTVAHSVTLGAMTLGWVTLPGWLVEPAIALSIVAVALENLVDPPPARRFAATVVLGLLHGFGFAGLLAELGLPPGAAIPALVAFNLGVEAGQLAVVALALGPLLRLRREAWWTDRAVPALSIGLALLGLGWFLTRL